MVSCYFLQVNVISKRLEISELDLHVTKVEEGLQWMEVILVTIELDEEVPKGEDSNNFMHKNGDELLPR
jgi:hypothetical protein